MKIAVRGGHNPQASGAVGLINEVTEDRKVKDSVIKYLKQLGHSVLDVTPNNMDVNSDLAYGVNKANSWGAGIFISIHFNKAYNSYKGAIGSEVCVYSKFDYAQRVVDKLGVLGFKNRGQKVRPELYELRNTSMLAMIVEVCFVEATEDIALYKKLGSDKIGKAIAEGVSNKNIATKKPSKPKEVYDMNKLVVYLGDADVFGAIMVAQKNQCPLMKLSDYKASGLKVKEVIQIGGKTEDKNRFETFKNAANKYL